MKSLNVNTSQNDLMLFVGVFFLLDILDVKYVVVILIVLGFLKTIKLLSFLPLKSKSVTLKDLIFY